MQRLSLPRALLYVTFCCLAIIAFHTLTFPCYQAPTSKMVPKDPVQYVYDGNNRAYPYDRHMPLIFIGGVPRSGTTLMRALLDAHPEVRCGEETRVIPRLLSLKNQWARSSKESKRLQEAGLSTEVIDSAISAFILEVIAKHGEPAPRLCNKDPFTLKSGIDLSRMFPNSKFLLMIRDGRAVVHSIITRKVTISGFDLSDYRKCLTKWNAVMEAMHQQCVAVGPRRCMPVFYEKLVLHPKEEMEKILAFLDLRWDDAVLHHDQFINKPGGISLSKTERSTDQVIKPINLEALTQWVRGFPEDVKKDIAIFAPMLARLGYDPLSFPPNYGQADNMVAKNTMDVKSKEAFWKQRGHEIISQSKPQRPYGWLNSKSPSNQTVPLKQQGAEPEHELRRQSEHDDGQNEQSKDTEVHNR